jgi:3-oxoacyl-[acyl-carrier-protein] synthase II
MCLALSDAKLNPEDVGYVNAHGTSTPLNDRIETLAIKRAFGEEQARRLMVSSTKSMTGHMLGAAGGVRVYRLRQSAPDGSGSPTINYTGRQTPSAIWTTCPTPRGRGRFGRF